MGKLRCVLLGLILIASALPLVPANAPEGEAGGRAVQRTVLGELFTATWCGYCPPADNAYDSFCNNASLFPDRFVAIEWHPTYNDVYGTTETDDRIDNYYGVSGYPTSIFDGVRWEVGGYSGTYNDYLNAINARPTTSAFTIQIDAKIVNNQYTLVTVNVTEVDSITNGSLKVRAVVVEDLGITLGNGAKLSWTARDTILGGSDLAISSGQTKSFKGNGTIGSGWDKSKLGVVAFVQTDTTREVLQAAIQTGFTFTTDAAPAVAHAVTSLGMAEDGVNTDLDLNYIFGDAEQDPMTFSASGANKVNVTINDGIARLAPSKDWNGQETIRFYARDQFTVTPNYNDVTVTVTAVNDRPTIKKPINDFSMMEGSSKVGINLDDVFADVDSQLAFTTSGNDHINVTIGSKAPHALTYTAPDLWTGKEKITFTAGDGEYDVSATVNVTVLHVNHAPTARPMADLTMPEDQTDSSLDLKSVFADLDGFETLSFTSEVIGGFITVSIDAQARVTLTPRAHWFGKDQIVFTAADGIAVPATSTLNVTVTKVNYVPETVGSLEKIILEEETDYTTTRSLKNVFKDINNDPLDFTVEFDAARLTVDINPDGTVSITPMLDVFGMFDLAFRATDPEGLYATYTCSITVSNINDAPLIQAWTPKSTKEVKLDEGGSLELNITAWDADADALEYTWSLDGRLLDGTGDSYTYSPDFKSAGTHRLTVVASDGTATAELTWTVKVADLNRKPVVSISTPSDGAVFESDAQVQLNVNVSDADNDKLNYRWTDNGADIGSLAKITVTLKPGDHIIKCEVSDGKETVTAEISLKVKSPPPAKSTPGFEGLVLLGALAVALAIFLRRR